METFDFDFGKIQDEVKKLNDKQKIVYIMFLIKELKRVINCFKRERYTSFRQNTDGCKERDDFIGDRFKLHYHGNNLRNLELSNAIDKDTELKAQELEDGLEYLENDLQYTEKVIGLMDKSTDDDYKEMWEELVSEYFKPSILRAQFEKIGDHKEDKYINYCVRRFRHWTIPEWMKYYEMQDKASQYKSLDEANLQPEDDYRNRMRITNAKFENSTLGQFAFDNLELFESKYIHKDYPNFIKTKIKNIREQITNTVKKIIPIKSEVKKIEQRIKDLELKFDTDSDDFPNDLKDSMQSYQEELKAKNETLDKYRYQLWGTFSNEGLIWKHDRLASQFKKESIGDEELFQELDYKSSERAIEDLKKKVSNILAGNGKEIVEDELDDLVLEVLKQHHSDDTEIFEEILNPELREIHIFKAINNVLIEKKLISKNAETINATSYLEESVRKQIKSRKKISTSNEVIAEEVVKLWDNGTEEFKEIYKKLSDDSERIFTEKLTEGQIKGKYQRFANKNKDFKRKK
jgi:hypothetical protein